MANVARGGWKTRWRRGWLNSGLAGLIAASFATLPVAALAASEAAATATASAPPPARTVPVTDTYFGTPVADPYRWMEDETSAEYKAWMKAQADHTSAVLNAIPGRAALLERVRALSNAGTTIYQVVQAGPRYFYLKQAPGDAIGKLYARQGLAGKETLLLDPERLTQGGVHYAIDYFLPSPDGRFVAYGVSPGGSEESTLKVIDVAGGKTLPEAIERARFGVTTWLPDNKTFLYNRLAPQPAGAPATDKYKKNVVYRHVVGTRPNGDGDAAEFGFGVNAGVPVDENEIALVVASPASPYALGYVQKFVKNEFTLYVAPLAALRGGRTPWVKVADEADEATAADIHGSDIYLLTHKNASRYQVLRTDARRPDLAQAAVVVPPGETVLRTMGVAKDGLYVSAIDGGLARVLRVPFAGVKAAVPVTLPYEGALGEFVVNPRVPGFLGKMTSWTQPQLWYAFDPATGQMRDTRLRPKSPVDFSAITSVEVKARSADGTLVPLSIVYRKDLVLDGSAPTLLEGYGSYGTVLDPGFNPLMLAWLERGGVFAVAHVRGGGEYGEDWHKAGQKLTKQNTIADFIACAEYLVANKYTSPKRLAGEGGSAGGITVGGALTQRPDLFAAIVDDVGMSDALRVELSANGPPNIPEFGSVTTKEGFDGLYGMSAYHHVKDATPYPAVLLTTGINDPRVAPWQMAKMTARLQAASTSGKPVLLRVDYDAGHGIGSTKDQTSALQADTWAFLFWQFGVPGFRVVAQKE